MALRPTAPPHRLLDTWRARYGGALSNVLGDPKCGRLVCPPSDGVVAYREGVRCTVAIGGPICHPDQAGHFEAALRERSIARGRSVVCAAASEAFTELCLLRGYAAVEFAEDLVIDPRRDPQA